MSHKIKGFIGFLTGKNKHSSERGDFLLSRKYLLLSEECPFTYLCWGRILKKLMINIIAT